MRPCSRCGVVIEESLAFCPWCGTPQRLPPVPEAVSMPIAREGFSPTSGAIAGVAALAAIAVTLAAFYLLVLPASNPYVTPPVTKPVVTFGPVQTYSNATYEVQVTGISNPTAATNFMVNVGIAGASGNATAFPSTSGVSVIMTVGSTAAYVTWTDVGGDGMLTAGDFITVRLSPFPTPGTALAFDLLWKDATLIQSTSWSA